jgi:hypothetical protein
MNSENFGQNQATPQTDNVGFNIQISNEDARKQKVTGVTAEQRAQEVFGIGDKTNVKR